LGGGEPRQRRSSSFPSNGDGMAGLAFTQDFVLPIDEHVDPTSSESSQAAPAENTA